MKAQNSPRRISHPSRRISHPHAESLTLHAESLTLIFSHAIDFIKKTRFEIREHLLEHHRTPEHEETPVENLTLLGAKAPAEQTYLHASHDAWHPPSKSPDLQPTQILPGLHSKPHKPTYRK